MIEISDLTVRFGGVVALDGVSIAVTAPVTGLIGPNGAGKTTLINALSGFVPVQGGSAVADGRDLLSMPAYRRARWGMARSFQKAQIVPDLTVEDHLSCVLDGCDIRGRQRREAIDRALEFTGIAAARRMEGARLDPFRRRMAEIARCLVARPKVLLLDEPGGGLSETETDHLRTVLIGLADQWQVRVLLIDHDVELIRDVCEETVVLDFGKLIAAGPTELVLRDEAVKLAYLGL